MLRKVVNYRTGHFQTTTFTISATLSLSMLRRPSKRAVSWVSTYSSVARTET